MPPVYHNDHRSGRFLGATVFFTVLSSIFAALRLIAHKGKYDVDAYVLIFGWIMTLACNITTALVFHYGMGDFAGTVLEGPDPLGHFINIFKYGLLNVIFWGQALTWLKMSLLLFYRRVFAVGSTRLHYVMWLVGAYLVLVGIFCFIDTLLSCYPIQFFWERTYAYLKQRPPVTGSCAALIPRNVLTQALNILSDLVILAIPIYFIFRLQISASRKPALLAVFLLGALTVIVGIIRIPILFLSTYDGGHEADPIRDNGWTSFFTILDANAALICACAPCLPPLWKQTKSGYNSWTHSRATGGGKTQEYHQSISSPGIGGGHGSVRSATGGRKYIPLEDWQNRSGDPKAHAASVHAFAEGSKV